MPTVHYEITEGAWTQVVLASEPIVTGEVEPGKAVRLYKGASAPVSLTTKAYSLVKSRKNVRAKIVLVGNAEGIFLRSEDGYGTVDVVFIT